METQQFKTSIDASPEKVWDVLWNDTTYPDWTSVFSPESRVETNWEEGSKVLFLDGKGDGMISTIAEKRPNEFMSFKHLGSIKNGVEDMDEEWTGSLENYTLRSADGKTELIVDMDVAREYMDFFTEIWPKALERVKELAENSKP